MKRLLQLRVMLVVALGLLSLVPAATLAAQAPSRFRAGEAVAVQWSAAWYPAYIMEVGEDRYRIRWEDGSPDEWVAAARVREAGFDGVRHAAARPAGVPPAPPVATPTTNASGSTPGGRAPATAPSAGSGNTPAPLAPAAAPPAGPPPPVSPGGQGTSGAAPTAPAAGVTGTWRYRSWISAAPGGRREMLGSDVTYFLTLRENGNWTITNTTRWSPNSPETVAWGTWVLDRGSLVLTQGGRPARVYGRYAVQQSGNEMTLRGAGGGDVIVVERR